MKKYGERDGKLTKFALVARLVTGILSITADGETAAFKKMKE